ncbi:hypothetical protein ACIBEK_06000 [Nocardia fusca]|uniref:hypothetical protein n=1 Tax=Nocardia fusca TaxID=941183 RepID=UPI0037877953
MEDMGESVRLTAAAPTDFAEPIFRSVIIAFAMVEIDHGEKISACFGFHVHRIQPKEFPVSRN